MGFCPKCGCFDNNVFKLSLLPSGVVRGGKLSVIGNGVVIDPWALKSEIEEIRGVSVSSGTIDSLLQMNWVKINGRRRVPGNPLAYGTTEEFLVHFDLESIKDLPEMQELKSMGLLDSNLPPDLYPENTINNNSIDEINDINTIEDSGEK